MATPNVPTDMAQFFDFGEAAMPEITHDTMDPEAAIPQKNIGCPAHGDDSVDGCLCHGFHDVALPEDLQQQPPAAATDAPNWNSGWWNSDFSSWLPRYQKPAQPCEYCRSRSLECFIYNTGAEKSTGCSPCNALFRPCSFNDPERMPMQKSKTALDTLDVVAEDSERHFGGVTGRKPMRSLGHVGPIDDEMDTEKPKRGAAVARFPRSAIKILKDWMIEHIDHPYPTEEDKETLKSQTGLTINQISNWMANTRRRQKNRPKRSASPSIRPNTKPMNIPAGRTWDDLNPFERWKHSPPENEPAPLTAIAKAVESFDPPEIESLSSSYNGRKNNSNDSTGSFSVFRAPSTTSLETGLTNMSSGSLQSHGTVWSHGSRNSFGSLNSLNSKKDRRRRRRLPARTPKLDLDSAPRLFQCTFCTDRFKTKYDWSRHEKSLHLSLEKWICAPIGEVIVCTASGQRKCVFCDTLDPTKDHLETHNYRGCEEKGLEARSFYRKDHLRQHLRLMHGCKMTASMESWRSEAQVIKSRCGFCAMNFDKWQDRVDHLAKEFKNGASMQNWKGCRGFDPHVAAHVTNAMPPYLIANESKSPNPFSATNTSSMKQHNLTLAQEDLEFLLPTDINGSSSAFIPYEHDSNTTYPSSISPTTVPTNTPLNPSSNSVSPQPSGATCWEILTLRLGRFAREHMEKQGPNSLSDLLLQQQARQILYDCDDPWNQTAADNPEWLALFKKSHGIASQHPFTTDLSHHEIMEDLGVNPGSQLDPSFDLSHFVDLQTKGAAADDSLLYEYECLLSGTLNNSKKASRMKGNTTPLTLPDFGSSTTSETSHIALPTSFDLPGLDAPISELACTVPGGVCYGEDGELGYAVRDWGSSKKKQHFFLLGERQCSIVEKQTPDTTRSLPNDNIMAPIQEQNCTKAGAPLFPTIKEQQCTKNGDPVQDHFKLPSWDQLPDDFHAPPTSAAPASTLPTSGPDVIQGNVSNPEVMRWDDTDLDLGFNIDMDMDLDLNVDPMITSHGLSQQR